MTHPYKLDDQVGYLLRLASQRHALIFQQNIQHDLTPTQFAALMRISEHGELSQNQLGRLAAIDIATIKGVVDRLRDKALVSARPDPGDKRRFLISLTEDGHSIVEDLKALGVAITEATLTPLTTDERETLGRLLAKIG